MKTSFVFRKVGQQQWNTWEPAQAVWLLQELDRPMADGGLGPNPEEPESFMPGRFTPGSMDTPWLMSTIEQWRGAAEQEVGTGPDTGMYEVGGVILERNPSSGEFNNYITAVKDPYANPFAVSSKESARGNLLIFDEEVDRSNRMIYEIKSERMNTDGRDAAVATAARGAMKRTLKKVPNDLLELPNTLGAMFISEAARLSLMLPLGMMLLDLIESQVMYGQTIPKPYTWSKLMKYKGDGEDRLTKAKLAGGKHPMMHENTIKQAKNFGSEFNVVTLRSVSILVAWLHMRLRKVASPWETQIISERIDVSIPMKDPNPLPRPIPNQQKKQFEQKLQGTNQHALFYTEAIRPALQARSSTLDLLL